MEGRPVRETVEALAKAMGATLKWPANVDGGRAAPAKLAGDCRVVLQRLLRGYNTILVVNDDPGSAREIQQIVVLGVTAGAPLMAQAGAPAPRAAGAPVRSAGAKTASAEQTRITEIAASEYRRRLERQMAWSLEGPQSLALALDRRASAAAGLPKKEGSTSAGYPSLYSRNAVPPAQRLQQETIALTLQMAGRDLLALKTGLDAQKAASAKP
jgi:ribosomal protein L10